MRKTTKGSVKTGPTPLDYLLLEAVQAGDAERTRALVQQGADPDAGFSDDQGYSNKTPLMYAAEGGHTPVIQELLAAGADVNATDRFVSPDDGGGETALEYAVRTRHQEAAQLLVEMGVDIKAMGGGYTPLMIAVQNADTALVRCLLGLGADPNRASKVCSPLELAVDRDRPEIAALLLRTGADPNWGDAHFGVTALIEAAVKGRLRCTRVLLDSGADVNQADSLGRTPLIAAAGGGVIRHLKTAEEVHRYSDSPDRAGTSLLTDENAREIVELLMAAGADVNAQNRNGDTALSVAARNGREEICRLLRPAGATSPARAGETAPRVELPEAERGARFQACIARLSKICGVQPRPCHGTDDDLDDGAIFAVPAGQAHLLVGVYGPEFSSYGFTLCTAEDSSTGEEWLALLPEPHD